MTASSDADKIDKANTTPDGRELESRDPAQRAKDDGSDAPLPHEADQDPESQHEDGARVVGEQAHRDLERGLVDTDRRGGDEYQRRAQASGGGEPDAET
jgi:hypothetical protein